MNPTELRERMRATGIGFAGIDGAWWLPATAPFRLPSSAKAKLDAVGSVMFTLLDVVGELYDTDEGERCGLNRLLRHKVPTDLLRFADRSPVHTLRPDFQLSPTITDGFVATELEICPSAQGYVHAMQLGYRLPTDLADAFAHFLSGRTLWFVSSEQWSEFVFEQLAFCRALHERGANGRVLLNLPIAQLADSIHKGQRWQPPIFGVRQKPPGWNDDLLQRVTASELLPWLYTADAWPETIGESAIFRFGYLECFDRLHLEQMQAWQRQGATFLNPLSFLPESKCVMATLHLPAVRGRIAERNPSALPLLDESIPETHLLTEDLLPQLLREQPSWIVKFAGFDAGNQAWGGRSLQIGAQLLAAQWTATLQRYLQLPFPTVVQRLSSSQTVDAEYFDASNSVQQLNSGTTRLRTFFLRQADGASAALGSHVTVSGGTLQVSEATDAVQSPVIFEDGEG